MDIKIVLQADDLENVNVGDMYLENGSPRVTSSLSEEVAQELFIRFKFFKGEWFLDPTVGVPYFQTILGQKVPFGIVQQIYRNLLTGCPGVDSIISFLFTQDRAKRTASLSFACKLKNGTVLNSSDFGDFILGA